MRLKWLKENGYARSAGLETWREFFPHLKSYGASRNFVDQDHSSVSTLSPWLNNGLLNESELATEALHTYSFGEVEKFLQEVYWRRYWRGYLTHRPHIWYDYRKRLPQLKKDYQIDDISQGKCSVEIMGYFAKQLVDTGYMHNHARMWFSAWWIHVEKLPWELGADFFLEHLIDGDSAVNTLSWRWVAGLHTKGKHYLARRNNLEKYVDPKLLSQYQGGLALLEKPVSPNPEDNVSPNLLEIQNAQAPDYSKIKCLVVFPDDLNIQKTVNQLVELRAKISHIHILEDSKVYPEFSDQKARWHRAALSAVVDELRHTDIIVEISSQTPISKSFAIRRPEIGYYTESYEKIISENSSAVPYYDEKKHCLNSYAKAGFFTYWKKTKKLLFSDV